MRNPFKTLSTKIVYQNPWIMVREDQVIRPDGTEGIYGVVESKDSVVVGAVNDEGQIYLIHSFSYPAQSWQWELPGGGSDGEEIIEASKREMAEETGIVAREWSELGNIRVCDGLMTERMHILLAMELEHGEKPESDDDGMITDGRFFTFDEVQAMVADGRIDEGQSIAALYFIEKHLAKDASS
jgi:8-oxo-dGTP pyrophosphatase MutT (NUDIX family)